MKYNNIIDNTISTDAHWQVNKRISNVVGTDAALLMADLVSKRRYFKRRNMLDKDGGFFQDSKELEKQIYMGRKSRESRCRKLVKLGLLVIKRKGVPPRNWYYIQDIKLLEILSEPVDVSQTEHVEKFQIEHDNDAQTGLDINNNKDNNNKNNNNKIPPKKSAVSIKKKKDEQPRAGRGFYSNDHGYSLKDIFNSGFLKLNNEPLAWSDKKKARLYMKSFGQMVELAEGKHGKGADDSVIYKEIYGKAVIFFRMCSGNGFWRRVGFRPNTFVNNWDSIIPDRNTDIQKHIDYADLEKAMEKRGLA